MWQSLAATTPKKRWLQKRLTGLLVSAAFSGVFMYVQSLRKQEINEHTNKVVQRVLTEQRGPGDIKADYKWEDLDKWQGTKVEIEGIIIEDEGVFFVKKDQLGQPGYVTLAPIIISKQVSSWFHDYHRDQLTQTSVVINKFILKTGFLPLHLKEKAEEAKKNRHPTVDYSETHISELRKLERLDGMLRHIDKEGNQFPPLTKLTAVVRRGERSSLGRSFYHKQFLYKWIDLVSLCRLFRVPNELQATTMYLEVTDDNPLAKDQIPYPASKQVIVDDVKTQAGVELKTINLETAAAVGVSTLFGVASLVL